MKIFTSLLDPQVIKILKNGGVMVLPTDTVYGICCRADNPKAINRIYELKRRDRDKKLIRLIADVTSSMPTFVHDYWPGPVSIILEGESYRLPDYPDLRELIRLTSPLVAPSANIQSSEPARTISEAQAYFGNRVNGYVDAGRLEGTPSKLIKIVRGTITVLR